MVSYEGVSLVILNLLLSLILLWSALFLTHIKELLIIFAMSSGAILWSSKKQPSTTLSSLKDEYIVITSPTCKVVWLQRILDDVKKEQVEATTTC